MTPVTPQIKSSSGFRPPSQGNIVNIVLLLIVLVCFTWFLVLPLNQQLNASRDQLHQAQAASQSLSQTNQQLQQLVSQMQTSTDDINHLNEALPLDNRPTKVDILLDSLAKTSGLTLSAIEPDSLGDKGDSIVAGNKALLKDPYSTVRVLHSMAFQVSLTGSIDQFINFLHLAETSSRLLDIDMVSARGDQNNLLSFHTHLKTYYYAPWARL